MRTENVVLVVVCGLAVVLAVLVSWRGRHLPVVTPREPAPRTVAAVLLDALRVLAALLTSASVAGALVVGLGGRLVMRVTAATSSPAVQGRLTEADETIGQITLGGTVAFVLFVGLGIPLALSFVVLPLRHVLPNRAWLAGIVGGVLLLGTVAVSDPLSPDNVDFELLTPTWLAVLLVMATALLFGTTFAALFGWLDVHLPVPSEVPSRGWGYALVYVSLLWLVLPFFLVPAAVYVVARLVSRGRVHAALDRPPMPAVATAAVLGAAVICLVVLGVTVAEIV